MPEDSKVTIALEMGFTHADFKRTLEIFMEGRPYTVSGSMVEISDAERHICITLGPENERRIGPTIRLPKTSVKIAFSGFSETDRKHFMERFELIFRRGGG